VKFSGAHFFVPLEKLARPRVKPLIGPQDVAGRVAVADAYEEFSLPPYGGDDAFVLNLATWGVLGFYVFLKEDPKHFYSVPFGGSRIIGNDPARIAREQLRKATDQEDGRLEPAHV
jgi:hypothetical protein